MAFPGNNTGGAINWSYTQAIIDVLTGVSGGGDQVQLIQYNNSSNYALDVRNLDTTNSYGLRVRDASNNGLLTVAKNAIGIGGSAADVLTLTGRLTAASLTQSPAVNANGVLVNLGGTLTEAASGTHARLSAVEVTAPTITGAGAAVTDASTLYVSGAPSASGASNWAFWVDGGTARLDGTVYIGDTANTNITLGLTINQGTNDDEILAFKSSDVAHGMTGICETDTFGFFSKQADDIGGLIIHGVTTDHATTGETVTIRASSGCAADTTKSVGGFGIFHVRAGVVSGTSYANVGADGNLMVIANNTTTRFIFDAEGSAHADVEWTTYDAFDDVALLGKLDAAMTQDPVKTAFGQFLADYRQELQTAKIVNFYSPDGPRAMVNFTRLSMLLVGAVRQLGERLQLAEQRLVALPGER